MVRLAILIASLIVTAMLNADDYTAAKQSFVVRVAPNLTVESIGSSRSTSGLIETAARARLQRL